MTRIPEISPLIDQMAEQISRLNLPNPLLIGIHTGGVWVADEIQKRLQLSEQMGSLDISFYRDDFSRVGLNPQVKASTLPTSVEDRNIILIDDVLYTGRTIRAAMNEIFSYGRPSMVTLGVLIERPGRELPIQAAVIGCSLELAHDEQVKLTKENDRLELKIIKTGTDL